MATYKATSSARSGIDDGSESDVAPTELVFFLALRGYKDVAPTELFSIQRRVPGVDARPRQ